MKKPGFFLHDSLNKEQIRKLMLFENEELIFSCREHWLPLVLRMLGQIMAGIIISGVVAVAFVVLFQSTALGFTSFLFIFLITGIVCVRSLIHWSFHLYVATNKQIIEVHYNPLFSHAVNSVLLDQIRCTEIDVSMYGLIPELIGIGNVELTFDRPTHKEEFVIRGVRSPGDIANLLSAQLHQGIPTQPQPFRQTTQPLWVKELKKNKYRFLGETSYGYTAG